MYKIIGADGREYGPVTAEVLCEWIVQGRANAETRVLPPGSPDWKRLGELAEFQAALNTAARPKAPAAFPVAPAPASMTGTDPLATLGLVLGIFSITIGLCCCYGFPFNLAGILCSAIALSRASGDPYRQQGRGVAMAGLVLSCLSLLVSGFLVIIWGILMASPNAVRHFHIHRL